MELKTLSNVSVEELCHLFNEAFADYFVKIELTPAILQEKITAEDIQLSKSAGIFINNKPKGFILHALREIDGEVHAYNAGTGIIPAYRGNKSTQKMYDFILPDLKASGVKKIVLEVMEQNVAAIKSYLNSGFEKTGKLECFNGKVQQDKVNQQLEFKKENNNILLEFSPFKDWQPTWQHQDLSVLQSDLYSTVCGYVEDKAVCYASLVPATGRVAQFCVHPAYRKQGIGTALFNAVSDLCPNGLSLINIDGNASGTLCFLKKMGLNHFLRQFKMELILD